MIRAWVVLSLLLLGSLPCPAQFSVPFARRVATGGGPNPIVQSVANTTACNFGSCSVTLSSAATAGDKLLVFVWDSLAQGGLSIADNNSTAIPILTCTSGSMPQAVTHNSGNLYEGAYTVPSGSPVTSVDLTFTGSFWAAVVVETTPSAASSLQDCGTAAYTVGNLNPLPTATPSSAPGLAFGIFFIGSSGPTLSPGAGWYGGATSSTTSTQLFVEAETFSGTSTVAAPIVVGGTGVDYPEGIVVLL